MTTKTPRAKADPQRNRIDKMEESIKETNTKLDSLVESVSSLASVIAQTRAVDRPVIAHKYEESEDQHMGLEGSAEFVDRGDGVELQRPTNIDTEVFTEDKMKDFAFGEEFIKVQIHSTSDKDADKVFEIGVNGEVEFFRRGETKRVKRKFVEGLCRAKPINYGNEEYTAEDGQKRVRYPTSVGVRYPFALVDPTPKEKAWFESLMAQP